MIDVNSKQVNDYTKEPGDHPELGELSSSNDQFVKIYL